MASYKDWMNLENPNNISESDLRKAVSQMSAAANKRLKRFEKAGISYGNANYFDAISGVRKFGVKGKTLDEVKTEFKRVRNFLNSPQSSLSGMTKVYNEFERRIDEITKSKYHRLNRKETKEFNKMVKQKQTGKVEEPVKRMAKYEKLKRWRDTWDYYNRLVEEGYYAPTAQDSSQVRDAILAQVYTSYEIELSEEDTWNRILQSLQESYEEAESEDVNNTDVSASSHFSMGESD